MVKFHYFGVCEATGGKETPVDMKRLPKKLPISLEGFNQMEAVSSWMTVVAITAQLGILMTRECFSLVSSWDELLCIKPLGADKWAIGLYSYSMDNIVARSYAVSKGHSFNTDSERNDQVEYNGHQLLKVGDVEYFKPDELTLNFGPTFDKSTLDLAYAYALENDWDKTQGFDEAWGELIQRVG